MSVERKGIGNYLVLIIMCQSSLNKGFTDEINTPTATSDCSTHLPYEGFKAIMANVTNCSRCL